MSGFEKQTELIDLVKPLGGKRELFFPQRTVPCVIARGVLLKWGRVPPKWGVVLPRRNVEAKRFRFEAWRFNVDAKRLKFEPSKLDVGVKRLKFDAQRLEFQVRSFKFEVKRLEVGDWKYVSISEMCDGFSKKSHGDGTLQKNSFF